MGAGDCGQRTSPPPPPLPAGYDEADVLRIAQRLRLRLRVAMFKVRHGWEGMAMREVVDTLEGARRLSRR
ncbi:hypothetical protein HK105_209523, partial [Polyrhizophydium stewartii]